MFDRIIDKLDREDLVKAGMFLGGLAARDPRVAGAIIIFAGGYLLYQKGRQDTREDIKYGYNMGQKQAV